uniref:NADH dehydrogenase subunit 6 n=1 Tax=Tetragnatha macilenta TaxID=545211 RepID=A0A343S597_9ARAC|nr:NADH dehydrogenase subunit 6 [Tetragnatha macilenta]
MVIFTSFFIIWGSHPILLMGGLVILVLSCMLYMYMMMNSFWMGYLLVLVMLSGVLVIFSYMLSLIPNLVFEEFVILFPLLLIMFSSYLVLDSCFFLDLSCYLYSIWVMGMNLITTYLVVLLLLLMVIVLYLSIMSEGSLRLF